MKFTKRPLPIEELIALLQARGLLIPDIEKEKPAKFGSAEQANKLANESKKRWWAENKQHFIK